MTSNDFVPVIAMINISDIKVNSYNVRNIDLDSAEFNSLVDSVKATNGIIHAVIVRPLENNAGKYELLIGKRRFYATQMAGYKQIKAEIVKADDETALLMISTENLQRKELTPFETAKILKSFLSKNSDYKAVASRLGVEVGWLAKRAKLCDLAEEWLEVMKAELFKLWSISHYELIARYEESLQLEILQELKGLNFVIRTWSTDQLANHLGKKMKLLKHSIWGIDDETIYPQAGSCVTCQKRTGVTPELFHDDLSEKAIKDNDRCLDDGCYQEKYARFIDREAERYSGKHENLIFVSGEYGQYEGNRGPVYNPGDVDFCKKSEKGAVPVLLVSGQDAGRLKYAKLVGRVKEPAKEKKESTELIKIKPPVKTKEKRLECRATALAIKSIRDMLEKCTPEAWMSIDYDPKKAKINGLVFPACLDREHKNQTQLMAIAIDMMALIKAFGTIRLYKQYNPLKQKEDWDHFDESKGVGGLRLIFSLWPLVAPILNSRLFFSENDQAEKLIPEAMNTCRLLGIDWNMLLNKAGGSITGIKATSRPKPKAKKATKKKTTKKKAAARKRKK